MCMTKIVVLILISIILQNKTFADVICNPWETNVRSHHVRAYQRSDSTNVESAERSQHCRERIKGAAIWGNKFSDDVPALWPHKTEKFKKWTKEEQEKFLKAVSIQPAQLSSFSFNFVYRAEKSIWQGNPAANLPKEKILVLYDEFFKKDNLERIVTHELSHLLYETWSRDKILEFRRLSGWKLSKTPGIIIPPSNLIEDDSAIDVEEDFTNHIEFYFYEREKIEKRNKSIYDFIKNEIGK